MKKALFDDSDSSGEETNLVTNKEYAKTYNQIRKKQLLKKLKDRDSSDSESSSDSSGDDDDVLNPEFNSVFLKALVSLKKKDPTIYNKDVNFFDGVEVKSEAGPSKKEKPFTVKEYEQKILLEKGGIYDEEDDGEDIDGQEKRHERNSSPSYREKQEQIRNEFKKALAESDDDEGDADDNESVWGGIFTKRKMTKEEEEKDKEEQEKWQKENEEQLKAIQEVWSQQKLSKDEVFLRDYILSNGFANKEDDEVPTYDEIVGENDEEFEEKQAEFEHKYNFRYEEPDHEFIKRYPRTIDNSVRKTDDRRKLKRVEVRERKEQEKQEKFREIEMLKELKRKEIEEKLEKLKAVTGVDQLQINDSDLDDDFDPVKYDQKMQAIFNNEYYQVDEGDEKPKCPSDFSDLSDLDVEDYDNFTPELAKGTHCEDGDFNMDCDYDENAEQRKKSLQKELIEGTQSRRKRRKRKSKFMEVLESEKPKFDPNDEKPFGEYLDEYYKLDCEDVVGDVKCRFKYVETVPNDFGLTFEEILLAKSKELNAWASMKKAIQIRPEEEDLKDRDFFRRKAQNDALKRKILASLYEPSEDEDEAEVADDTGKTTNLNSTNGNAEQKKKKKKKKKRNENQSGNQAGEGSSVIKSEVPIKEGEPKEEIEKVKKELLQTPPEKPKKEIKDEKPNENSIVNEKTQTKGVAEKKANHIKAQNNKNQKGVNEKYQSKNLNKSNPFNVNKKPPQNRPPSNQTQNQKSKKLTNGMTDDRLRTFGINPNKYKWKLKHALDNGVNSNKFAAKKRSNADQAKNVKSAGPPNKKFKAKQ